jgi:hypothetical protein
MINSQIKELEVKIANVINESEINIATIALVLDKLAKEANVLLTQAIAQEQAQLQQKMQASKEEIETVETEIVE